MSNDDEQIRELIASQQEHCPTVPPIVMETQGYLKDRKVEQVVKEGAIALIMGEDLAGDSWSQGLNLGSETWTCLWVMILAMENQELGSFYIDAPRNDAGDTTYQKTVRALAKNFAGVGEPGDEKIIQKHVKPSHYIHKDQLEDVRNEMLKIQAKKEEKLHKGGKRSAAESEKEGVPAEPKKVKVASISSVLSSGITSLHIERTGGNENDEVSVDANVAIAKINGNVINKATFTIAIVKDITGEKVVGYLIRFLVHDQRWNPGKMVDELIKGCIRRDANKGNPRFKEPYPMYLAWQKTW